MGVSALLRSFGDDEPSGENLEYDPVFTEMELAAAPGEERQMGDSVLAAEEPDWREVAQKATAVLEQSHDIRAAVYLATAELAMRGLPGFADVTGYIRGCLEDYWDTCHPQLDADDDNDPTMRVNIVAGLCDSSSVLNAIRKVHSGQRYISPRITARLEKLPTNEPRTSPFDELSERELQVALMLIDSQKVNAISEKLQLSRKTVYSYRYRIFDKLGLSSDVELTILAVKHGLSDASSLVPRN